MRPCPLAGTALTQVRSGSRPTRGRGLTSGWPTQADGPPGLAGVVRPAQHGDRSTSSCARCTADAVAHHPSVWLSYCSSPKVAAREGGPSDRVHPPYSTQATGNRTRKLKPMQQTRQMPTTHLGVQGHRSGQLAAHASRARRVRRLSPAARPPRQSPFHWPTPATRP
jgi:hypothetical protein